MKKLALLFLCLLLLPLPVLAEGSYYGEVTCLEPHALLANFGGMVEEVFAIRGQYVHAGDELCRLGTVKQYAPVDGTVTALFGQAGDGLEELKNRCGSVLAITPEHGQCLSATTRKAARSTKAVLYVGQTVTLAGSLKDSLGTGRVIDLTTEEEETAFTVEVLSGQFYLGETVIPYADADCNADSKLGSGSIEPASPVLMGGEGSLLTLHVKEGDRVKRGQLLYECVGGTLDGKTVSPTVLADRDGIVAECELSEGASVEQNAVLLSLYPKERFQVTVIVPETDLGSFATGQKVQLEFAWNGLQCEGSVAAVSYLQEKAEDESKLSYANYRVLIDFEADESCRMGMMVKVDIP